jgi:hypothetical protein
LAGALHGDYSTASSPTQTADADRKIASALQVPARVLLSRTDLLALAASAKTRQERQRYRRMAEDV